MENDKLNAKQGKWVEQKVEVEVEVDSHRLSTPHIFFCGESSKRPMSSHTYNKEQSRGGIHT